MLPALFPLESSTSIRIRGRRTILDLPSNLLPHLPSTSSMRLKLPPGGARGGVEEGSALVPISFIRLDAPPGTRAPLLSASTVG